jgi:hypothetical protein
MLTFSLLFGYGFIYLVFIWVLWYLSVLDELRQVTVLVNYCELRYGHSHSLCCVKDTRTMLT